jgi:hypothetical protein
MVFGHNGLEQVLKISNALGDLGAPRGFAAEQQVVDPRTTGQRDHHGRPLGNERLQGGME